RRPARLRGRAGAVHGRRLAGRDGGRGACAPDRGRSPGVRGLRARHGGRAARVAMGAAWPARRTAAVARVFAGFALAAVIGLPVGSLVGQAYGWHATFVLVAGRAGAGVVWWG